MKNILTGLAVSLIAVTLLAQTGVSVRQIATDKVLTGSVLVVTPTGAGWAKLGPGLALIDAGGVWTLEVHVAHQRVAGERLTAVVGNYALAHTPLAETLMVFRNGIRQTEDVDYTFAAGVIRPLPAIPWEPSDLVVATYQF